MTKVPVNYFSNRKNLRASAHYKNPLIWDNRDFGGNFFAVTYVGWPQEFPHVKYRLRGVCVH